MAEEISFIRRVARHGNDLVVTVPREHRDLYRDKRVKVTVLED